MTPEAEIQSILGALVAGRCYPLIAPQGVARPYITFQEVSNVPLTLDNGTQARLQVDVWSTTSREAKALALSVRDAIPAATFPTAWLSSGDLYEAEVQLYRVTMDFYVWL